MNLNIPRLLSLAALLLATAFSADTHAAEALKIYGVEEAPGSFASNTGRPIGLTVDIAAEIQRRVGNHDPVKIVPETLALESARTQPNVVAFSFSRTAERESQFHWITQVVRKPWVLYALKTSKLEASSLGDMRTIGKIGVVDGDVRAKYLQKEEFGNLVIAADPEENIRNLLNGTVHAIFYEPAGVAFYCRKLKCENLLAHVYSPRSSDVYLLMSKGTDPKVVKAWQDAAAAMKSDGTFDRIARRWIFRSAIDFGIESSMDKGVVAFK